MSSGSTYTTSIFDCDGPNSIWTIGCDDDNDVFALYPTVSPYAPAPYSSSYNYPTYAYENEVNKGPVVIGTIFAFMIIFGCIFACKVNPRLVAYSEPPQPQQTARSTDSPRSTEPAATTTPRRTHSAAGVVQADEKRAASLRAKVVRAIFPEQKVDSSNLEYDPEANSYRWANKKNADTTCSICIEKFQEGDVVVTSLCNHSFHSDCIMGWSQIKADCPVCRQKMWDPRTFKMLEKEIKQGAMAT